jgi:hypothetical protein
MIRRKPSDGDSFLAFCDLNNTDFDTCRITRSGFPANVALNTARPIMCAANPKGGIRL